jgi:hypothetical protein
VSKRAQLKWIQGNRSHSVRTERVDTLLCRYVRECYEPRHEEARKIASILADTVDEEFRNHCVVAAVEHGVVLVHVDHPGLVYAMRTRWLDRLLQVLVRDRRRPSVRGIAFRFGNDGERIATARTGEHPGC